MANTLVQTTFQTGPKDALAAVDVYKEVTGRNVVNRIQKLNTDGSMLTGGGFGGMSLTAAASAAKDLLSQASNAISGARNASAQSLLNTLVKAAGATSLLSGTAQQIAVNKAALTDRILSASSTLSNAVRNVTGPISDKIMSAIPLSSKLSVMVNGVRSKISSANLNDIASIGRVINDVSGSRLFTSQDNGAIAGIVGSIVGSAISMGVPNAFNAMTSQFTDKALLGTIVKVAMPYVVKSSNLSQLVNISDSTVGKVVNAIFPGVLKQVSNNYVAPRSVPIANRPDYSLSGFMRAAGNVNKNWDKQDRNGRTILNVKDMIGGSSDFNTMITRTVSSIPDDKKVYALAACFREEDTATQIKNMFSNVSLKSLSRTTDINSNIVSPNLA